MMAGLDAQKGTRILDTGLAAGEKAYVQVWMVAGMKGEVGCMLERWFVGCWDGSYDIIWSGTRDTGS